MGDSAKLSLGDATIDLPLIEGTEKGRAVDIRKLYPGVDFLSGIPQHA